LLGIIRNILAVIEVECSKKALLIPFIILFSRSEINI